MHAAYSLSHLIVTGKCAEAAKGGKKAAKKSKRGSRGFEGRDAASACTAAALELRRASPWAASVASAGNNSDTIASDTLVIGSEYYQLQGSPGLWALRLASGAPRLSAASGSSPPAAVLSVSMLSYTPSAVDIAIGAASTTRAGRSSVASKDASKDASDDTVHVFSLASGHLCA